MLFKRNMLTGSLLLLIFSLTFYLNPIWADEAVGHEESEHEHQSPHGGQVVTGKDYYIKETLFGHLHNKVIHFPIAFGVGAALLFLLALRWPEMKAGARVLVLLGALSTIISVFPGLAQKGPYEGSNIIKLHQNLGIVTTFSFWIWVLFSYWRPLKRYAWIWGLVVAALVMVTAFYGGQLTH